MVMAVATCGGGWLGFCGLFGGLWILYVVAVGCFGDGNGFCGWWWQCQRLGVVVASGGGGLLGFYGLCGFAG